MYLFVYVPTSYTLSVCLYVCLFVFILRKRFHTHIYISNRQITYGKYEYSTSLCRVS